MTKILIADDEANIVMLLEIMLKDMGLEVISAKNGKIAIEKAEEHKPDLIITDIIMPQKNGFELCKAVRNMPDIANNPIIIISALGDEYNKITGFEEGADDYITKPFNIEEMKARVKSLLNRHKKIICLDQTYSQDPEHNIDVIPTSCPNLDNALYGGLPKGSNILVIGKIGKGKSSFARHFIEEGLKRQEKCLFIAIDDDPKRIRNHLNKTVNLANYEGQLHLVDAYSSSSLLPPENEPFALNGPLELNQLSGVISDASFEVGQTVQKKCGGRRVVDSISSLLVQFKLEAVQCFLNQISRTALAFGGVTTLFIIEEGTVSDQVLNNIKYIMDGVLEFGDYNDRKSIKIAHMKWTRYDKNWIPIN